MSVTDQIEDVGRFMAAVDITTVDISELTDLREIKIDTLQLVEKKLEAFARQGELRHCERPVPFWA